MACTSIYLGRDGQLEGPFHADALRARLYEGRLAPTDLAWYSGAPGWMPVEVLLKRVQLDEGSASRPDDAMMNAPAGVPSTRPIRGPISSQAIASFVCGILGLGLCFPALLAVVLGRGALDYIGRSHGTVRGRGLAIAGMALGYGYFGLFALAIIVAVLTPAFRQTLTKAQQMRALGNCMQITMSLKEWAEDHGGLYPDSDPGRPRTANEAFRLLFRDGILEDEFIFGCPRSPFHPDRKTGPAPDYTHALEPSENHWVFTKGQGLDGPGILPLVFENPAEYSWPPKWNATLAGQELVGRCWEGGKVVIGLNDGSASVVRLDSGDGLVTACDFGNDSNVFTQAARMEEILPVLTR